MPLRSKGVETFFRPLLSFGIDAAHFGKALTITEDPADQKDIGRPRIGFFGVIDERTDIDLLEKMAQLRPDWNFIMIGPVVKIDADDLPKLANIHYLGGKHYDELPAYIAGWDAAMMPFAMNESTRFISPTKTPEYLAAGPRSFRPRSGTLCGLTQNWALFISRPLPTISSGHWKRWRKMPPAG